MQLFTTILDQLLRTKNCTATSTPAKDSYEQGVMQHLLHERLVTLIERVRFERLIKVILDLELCNIVHSTTLHTLFTFSIQ